MRNHGNYSTDKGAEMTSKEHSAIAVVVCISLAVILIAVAAIVQSHKRSAVVSQEPTTIVMPGQSARVTLGIDTSYQILFSGNRGVFKRGYMYE